MLNSIKCKWQLVLFQKFNLFHWVLIAFLTLLIGCKAKRTIKVLKPSYKTYLNNNDSYFKGVLVVDASNSDTLMKYNHDKYFIPASNVKILTFYTGTKLLGKRVAALNYEFSNDTLFVEPTGDPSFLNPNLGDSTAFHFLKKFNKVALLTDNYDGDKFMPGWSWEDYPYYYSPEVSAFPIYRNVVQVSLKDSLTISPNYFRPNISVSDRLLPYREQYDNSFNVPTSLSDTLQIPFITSMELTANMLSEMLKTKVVLSDRVLRKKETLLGMPVDSLYKQMLWESDNFTAEQLILSASSKLSDTLGFNRVRDFMLENYLVDIQKKPRWVDGSGLSRYNLFTPQTFVSILEKLSDEAEKNNVFNLFPAWDANGTIQKPDKEENYFIYAKSGSFGNVYNLSGYLKTRKGRLLLFSLMNNNFRVPSRLVRLQMYGLLKSIHENY